MTSLSRSTSHHLPVRNSSVTSAAPSFHPASFSPLLLPQLPSSTFPPLAYNFSSSAMSVALSRCPHKRHFFVSIGCFLGSRLRTGVPEREFLVRWTPRFARDEWIAESQVKALLRVKGGGDGAGGGYGGGKCIDFGDVPKELWREAQRVLF